MPSSPAPSRQSRASDGDAVIKHLGQAVGGVVYQFAHVVLGKLALAVQLFGELIELGVNLAACALDDIAKLFASWTHTLAYDLGKAFPGAANGGLRGRNQALPGVVYFFLKPGHGQAF